MSGKQTRRLAPGQAIEQLRDLERHGIVQRIDYAEVPPRVEYKLTRMGDSLGELVRQMEEWVVVHYSRMTSAAHSFDARAERETS